MVSLITLFFIQCYEFCSVSAEIDEKYRTSKQTGVVNPQTPSISPWRKFQAILDHFGCFSKYRTKCKI